MSMGQLRTTLLLVLHRLKCIYPGYPWQEYPALTRDKFRILEFPRSRNVSWDKRVTLGYEVS